MEEIHDTFAIEISEFTDWNKRSKKNNFFELVYVLEGRGFHSVNYVNYPYQQNGIFLLPVAKCHQYTIEEKSKFLFLRFSGNYFSDNQQERINYSNWFSRINFILANHSHLSGELIDETKDKLQLKRLLDVIVYEYNTKDTCSEFIIQSTLVSALAVICRNIQRKVLQGRNIKDQKFEDLLNFISFNILDSRKITVEYLSDKFHISKTYFSEYFKRNASERFQDYVLKSKLRIALSRAKYTDHSMQEIALDLGFTDSSHLNRMMKKQYDRGMREIRKEMQS